MTERDTFYITTPIYYPSDNLHIGHAYTTVAADCMARFKRMQGYEVHYLTGTDEHGQKIERVARDKGMEPLEYVDNIVADIKSLWKQLLISNTDFIRTTEKRHEKIVQKFFQKVYDQGDIYKSQYEGWYCTPCETFFTERQLVEGKCPDCGRDVEILKEESYFFRMSKYAEKLLQHIDTHPDFIQPESRRNEVINFIKSGLDDLCVSRTTFKWGIPVPFDNNHVVYVWFDALINYLSAVLENEDNPVTDKAKFWPADVHLMAKDILRFHAIIWPIMLMAMDIPLPKKVFAHGWILLEGGKMSKSKGNVVDPRILIEKYGVDAIRYYLIKELTFGQDGIYSEDMLVNRINTDLANDLGNLVSRTAAMIIKYFDGVLPERGEATPFDKELEQVALQAFNEATTRLEKLDFSNYLGAVFKLVARANKYIDENEPWQLAKEAANQVKLATVMYNLVEAIRVVTILTSPTMPTLMDRINQQIPLFSDTDNPTWSAAGKWGLSPAGIKLTKGKALFPRIDLKNGEEKKLPEKEVTKENKPESQEKPAQEYITIDDFAKIDFRVGEVIACEKMKKADKLLILQVKIGDEERTIVSGIAQHYTPEEMVGKKIVVVANLKPTKLRGVMSEGMLLAASNEEQLEVLTLNTDIRTGSRVK